MGVYFVDYMGVINIKLVWLNEILKKEMGIDCFKFLIS